MPLRGMAALLCATGKSQFGTLVQLDDSTATPPPDTGYRPRIRGADWERDRMTEAYIYDHVRTPRGKGKPDGALHEVTPVNLASQVLQALCARNSLDSAEIEDVVLGCVQPVGEQGGNIARIAALN